MSTLNEEARLRIMAARIIAQNRWPYLSSLLFSLRLVEMDHSIIPTMAVDKGWRLYYSPEFVLAENAEALATVLLHECMHCVMAHNERFLALDQSDVDHNVWNVCGDCAINDILDESDMPWTEEVTPVRYSNFEDIGIDKTMITETAYAKVRAWQQGNKDDDRLGSQDCGSVADNNPRDYELDLDDEHAPSMSQERQASIRDRVASDVIEASKSMGNVSGGLKRWAQDHLDPQVDWRRQLGVHLRKSVANIAGRRDYSYVRPSRRQEAMRLVDSDILLPSLRQPSPPRVAIVVDTSGSVSDSELRTYLGEIAGIVKAVGVAEGINVIPCDSQAQTVQRLRSIAKIEDLELIGGGGTDMREGINAALSLKPSPNIIVVITDGATPWHIEQPNGCDNYIVILTKTHALGSVPFWMRTISIEIAYA
jgi:predicted metal-dependent peptidase